MHDLWLEALHIPDPQGGVHAEPYHDIDNPASVFLEKKYALPFGTRSFMACPGLTKQISPMKPTFSISYKRTIFLNALVKLT